MLTWDEYMEEKAKLLADLWEAKTEAEWEQAFMDCEERTGIRLLRSFDRGIFEELPYPGQRIAEEIH